MPMNDDLDRAGGAFVRRQFMLGDVKMKPGDRLSIKQLELLPIPNRKALVNMGAIELWLKGPDAAGDAPALGERFVYHRGGGRYDVIAGVKFSPPEGLTKDEAEALAAAATAATAEPVAADPEPMDAAA